MTAAARIRVLCIDDHTAVREGIATMINRNPDMAVIALGGDGMEAVALYRQHRPDVTLMDLRLPTMSGLEAICRIRAGDPSARVIVLTMYQGDEDIFRALKAGAATYLLKDAPSEELIDMVRRVNAGESPIPPNIAHLLASRAAHQALSPRELETLQLIGQGLRNKEIASRLQISEDTTKQHIKSLFLKLNVSDRTAAINVALRRGIIHIE
jgi:two-component system NarL family response regulator